MIKFIRKISLGLLLSLTFSISALAADGGTAEWYALVIGGSGKFSLSDKPLKIGDKISSDGVLKTEDQSFALIYFRGKDSTVTLAPNSMLNLARPNSGAIKPFEVKGGKVRFSVGPKSKPAQWFKVQTTGATMGVRGTDFFATYDPAHSQTEIVVYEGKVHFENLHDSKDFKDIPAEYWGGIGGALGNKVSNLVHLPQDKLAAMKQNVDVKAQIKPQD